MRPVHDINGGKPTDYTDKLIEKVDEVIAFCEKVKEYAHDDCPYDVEYNADGAKHALREVCEIAKRCSDNYERTADNCVDEARPTDRKKEA